MFSPGADSHPIADPEEPASAGSVQRDLPAPQSPHSTAMRLREVDARVSLFFLLMAKCKVDMSSSLLRSKTQRAFLLAVVMLLADSAAAQVRMPAERGVMQLEAKQQRKEGNVFYGDGDVDIRFDEKRLRADHVRYDEGTNEAVASGHVRFDFETQHLEADEGH